MAGQNRYELLGLALLAATMASFLGQVTAVLSAPVSTPMDFVFREGEQRDGRASLGLKKPSEKVVLRLAFVGDIMQHRRQATDNFQACYRELSPLLAGSDLAAGNLEFPVDVTQPLGPPDGSVQFNGSPAHVAALAKAGFDVLSTSNNHCFDQGAAGLARTQQVLMGFGLTPVGNLGGASQDRPVIMERNGLRIGFFVYTFRPNSYADGRGEIRYWQSDWPVQELNFADWSAEYRGEGLGLTGRHVDAARGARVDWLVALVHWGREWQFQPTADQRLAGRDLIDQGFDMVVGSHSHVINPLEVYRGRLIAYSLGNLISDFRPWEARTGAVLQVDLARPSQGHLEIADFRAIPIFTELPGHHVRPMRAEGAADETARDLARKVLGPACVFADSRVSAR
jgi:poly-gamma-glutamate capsule biosynthesis protein CapA/YwtB (metallophosphatase superfamily)